ncbi:LysR substrate-binding domain-containing protein [Bradyrhizobium arachidis]|uniref:LysR substrate-binding domain-containing protein n=1 Tax=Bradyrhizobium arachidis TaxID=858423 RepID=UPI00216240AC|nr:LysR substrate-binding domain-containing protein [Bradyrhizobium arachidis]UVO30195.1 LysR family transcriptional regulator [Bradyrhizobium arachidis]
MDIRQLRYFIAVAEELNFSRAARRLNLSQPPLSLQIKALEHDVGAPLFLRQRRGVELTQAGQILLEQAREALAKLDHAIGTAQRAARGEVGLLRIGYTGSAPIHASFSKILRRFSQTYPEIRLELLHASTSEQAEMLTGRRLDLGFLRPSPTYPLPKNVTIRRLWSDPLELFAPTDHPLVRERGPIAVPALKQLPFIFFASASRRGLNGHVVHLCGSAGFTPKVVQEAEDGGAILGLVAAGLGVAVLPKCYGQIVVSDVVRRPLTSAEAKSDLYLAYNQDRASDHLMRFVALGSSTATAG